MFTNGLLTALAQRNTTEHDAELRAFAMSLRGSGGLDALLPAGVARGREPHLPASLLLRMWGHIDFPGVELWSPSPDVVHGTNYVAPPSKRAARLITVHDLTAVRFPKMCTRATLRYPALIRRAVSRGAHIHVLTNAMAKETTELLDIPEQRVHVVAPGLPDVSSVVPQTRPSRRYVLALGTIEPRKDYPLLLRAFDRVASTVADVDLIIVGAPGWSMEEFDLTLARMNNRERVRLLGRVDDTERVTLLRGASALAYPSVYEGFGLPPLEAMQVGVPVVATANAAVAETAGEAARLTPVGDTDAFGAALEEVLEDTSTAAELIGAGRVRVKTFDWATAAGEMMNLYRTIAEERS